MPGDTDYKNLPLESLIPYARNSRTHTDAQVSKIAASIREFGFLNPVIVDKDHGIVAGHGRVLAAKKLGLVEVPCIEAAHLTDAQKRAYVIADNRLALDAGWDEEMLKIELADLQDSGFDLSLTGFAIDELTALTCGEVEGLTDEDAMPRVSDSPVTALGDVWLLGNHRLMCGDSFSVDAVSQLVGGRKVDFCFTDPMYNDSVDSFLGSVLAAGVRHLLLMCTQRQLIAVAASNSGFQFRFDLVLYFKVPSSSMNKKVPYFFA